MGAALTKDQILNAEDTRLEPLDMTAFGWPGVIYIPVLRGSDAQKIADVARDGVEKHPNYLAYMAAMFIRDENGLRMFEEKELGALNMKSAMALQHIVEAGGKLNKLDDLAVSEAKKNLEATDGSGSSTD